MKVAGTVLTALSLAFVALFVARHWSDIGGVNHPGFVVAAALVYAACVGLYALVWPLLLRQRPIWPMVQIGLVSQVAKYIPGNVAHYLGRAAMAKAAGIPLKHSAGTTALEVGIGILAAVIVALVSIAPLLSAVLLALFAGRMPVLITTACVLLTGLSFALVARGMGDAEIIPLVSIFAAAWLAGFVTPGAPAGIGLREGILIASLSPMIGAGSAITAALLHRLVTALVDATIGLLAWRRRCLA